MIKVTVEKEGFRYELEVYKENGVFVCRLDETDIKIIINDNKTQKTTSEKETSVPKTTIGNCICIEETLSIEVEKAYKAGMLWKNMQEHFGLTDWMIRSILKKRGVELVRKRGYSDTEKQKIKSLYLDEKKTIKEIAYMYGDSEPHIARMLKSIGVSLRGKEKLPFPVLIDKKITPQDEIRILELRSQKCTINQIAKNLGFTYYQIKAFLSKNKN